MHNWRMIPTLARLKTHLKGPLLFRAHLRHVQVDGHGEVRLCILAVLQLHVGHQAVVMLLSRA